MNQSYQIYSNEIDWNRTDGLKLYYGNSAESSKGEGFISVPDFGLLNQTGVHDQNLEKGTWEELPCFFEVNSEGEQLPFDMFSAVFFLITRYEEYLPNAKRDEHERYLAESSILSELNVLERPIVDLWCKKLWQKLSGESELNRAYTFISTIDVDNAFAFKHKSFPVKLGGTLKAISRGDNEDLSARMNTYFRRGQDPYDTYDYIHEVHQEVGVKNSIFFFLLSDRNEYDKNLSYTNQFYRGLIQALHRGNKVGIHPGYHSSTQAEVMLEEKLRLEDIIGEEVLMSRQHFLKFKFPTTAAQLVKLGIKQDFSLGYAERLGFRAGTCTPFLFYDLTTEKITELEFHSSAIMDATLNRYLGLNPKEAVIAADEVIKEVKSVGGELVTIWHNETLSELREWKGWKSVFPSVLKLAR